MKKRISSVPSTASITNEIMKLRLLILSLFLSVSAWSQATFTVVVGGTIVDSTTGMGLSNYPVIVSDSSNTAFGGMTTTLFTDANGNYNDTLLLYGTNGVLIVQTQDSCSGNWLSASTVYGNNTSSFFSFYNTFALCGSTGSGSGTGGGGSSTSACVAQYSFDSTLTGMGQIVLYNSSYVDSTLQNATVTYVWDFGDGTTAVGAYPSHVYTAAGSYAVCLTLNAQSNTAIGMASCTSTYCDTVVVDTSGNVSYKNLNVTLNVFDPAQLSLEESATPPIKIYPNPSSGLVWVELPQRSDIQLFSMTGRRLFTGFDLEEKVQLPLLNAGSYLIEVVNAEGKTYQLLLVH